MKSRVYKGVNEKKESGLAFIGKKQPISKDPGKEAIAPMGTTPERDWSESAIGPRGFV